MARGEGFCEGRGVRSLRILPELRSGVKNDLSSSAENRKPALSAHGLSGESNRRLAPAPGCEFEQMIGSTRSPVFRLLRVNQFHLAEDDLRRLVRSRAWPYPAN